MRRFRALAIAAVLATTLTASAAEELPPDVVAETEAATIPSRKETAASNKLVLRIRGYEAAGDIVLVTLGSGEQLKLRKKDVDFQLTNAVLEALREQMAAMVAATSSEPPSIANGTRVFKAKCGEKWPEDFVMRKSCQDQQLAALEQLHRREMSGNALTTARAACAGQWPDDFTMRDFCERQQIEALEALVAE